MRLVSYFKCIRCVGHLLLATLWFSPRWASGQTATPLPQPGHVDRELTRSEPMPPLNSRLFIGAEMGTLLAPKVWIEGKRAEGGDSGLHAGAQAGYVQDLGTSNVRLLTMGRFSSWDSEWASTRHESRFRIDLSVGPEFRVESKPARPRLGWHFSAPVGLTIGSPGRQSGRAVSEVHAVGYGINLGLNAGIDISGRHHGGYVDLGYLAHVMWMKHTSTLTARPSTTLVEQYRLADHVLMLTFGYLYWL